MSFPVDAVGRPTAPIFDVDESKDVQTFYHNVAYKTNRVVINVEKMKVRSLIHVPQVEDGVDTVLSCTTAADPERPLGRVREKGRRKLHR